jgi:hypothetical protein
MPNQQFLEEYPLLKNFKVNIPNALNEIPRIPIHMNCENCKSEQTFNMVNQYFELAAHQFSSPSNSNLRLLYRCQFCKMFERVFYIYISHNLAYIYKIGQYPEWEIKIDKNLENTLRDKSKTFKKGLVCESQGYGIGAFAYYRRITEEIIDELLNSIQDLIDEKDKVKYKDALEKTKSTRVTQEKIELVKDLLPPVLKPNGMNPLGVLHSELSEGLHSETEESCLENAAHIREILTFLINQVMQSKQAAKNFTESMKAILTKKSSQNLSKQ